MAPNLVVVAVAVVVVALLAGARSAYTLQIAPAVLHFSIAIAVLSFRVVQPLLGSADALAAISGLRGNASNGQQLHAQHQRYCQITNPCFHKSPLPFL